MAELTFRNATEEDVPLILEFIKKLADYEHRLDEVIATEEALEYWIFDKNQAEVIFALEDGKEIGFAFFFSSKEFYKSIGADQKDWNVFHFTGPALDDFVNEE